MRQKPHRRSIALLAAYVLALQAVLAGFPVVSYATAVASAGVICSHHGGAAPGGSQAPTPDNPCPCGPACTMADGGTLAVLERRNTVIAWAPTRARAIALADPADVTIPDPHAGTHLPRAPPAA